MTHPRIGLGWDVHRIEPGRPLRLVGLTLDPDRGPVAHSDGDVLAHAVVDALLGAAGLDDIGTLFPDDDPRWKGAAGPALLELAVAALADAGWRPLQVDAVIIADRPRIAPHRDALRRALADCLGLGPGDVNVKGKRTEGLGGLAGGAGIGCRAIVQIGPLGDTPR
ncbi:MAG: 2-C-methyl-D-erythritol 2,4-cyclodiphosphate synthase [Acidobacteriota bacterium]|nr:MAG: 2-C-methyl-D-erythritol 2,4-cyclodiphosphate synthase [Acidobacteriota bacterium]